MRLLDCCGCCWHRLELINAGLFNKALAKAVDVTEDRMYLFIYFYEEAAEDRDLEARRGASPMMTG